LIKIEAVEAAEIPMKRKKMSRTISQYLNQLRPLFKSPGLHFSRRLFHPSP